MFSTLNLYILYVTIATQKVFRMNIVVFTTPYP